MPHAVFVAAGHTWQVGAAFSLTLTQTYVFLRSDASVGPADHSCFLCCDSIGDLRPTAACMAEKRVA